MSGIYTRAAPCAAICAKISLQLRSARMCAWQPTPKLERVSLYLGGATSRR